MPLQVDGHGDIINIVHQDMIGECNLLTDATSMDSTEGAHSSDSVQDKCTHSNGSNDSVSGTGKDEDDNSGQEEASDNSFDSDDAESVVSALSSE